MRCTKAHRLSLTKRAQQIVGDLSLEEKVYLMAGNGSFQEMIDQSLMPGRHYNDVPYPAGGIERHNIPPMLFCDGPRGVVCGTGKSTCFPVTMLRGATFDKELEYKIGKAIGREVRAYGGNTFAGVCINLPYHPGWGRSQETYGEESFQLGEMGSALVKGVQEENVTACVKHFAFNQMEISRFKVDVECGIRTEREVFLPHFKKCIDAGAGSVMSAYNLYQGTYCGHHDYLLNYVLKDEWGFDGFIMSDFGWGVRDTVEGANGGQNIEMPCTTYFGETLVQAVKDGKVAEEKIDDAALRIVRTLLAFEEAFEEASDEEGRYDLSVIGCKEHVGLALQAAREGITLIQNKKNVLPLDRKRVKKIAVIGKLGDEQTIGDHGSSRVFPKYVVSPREGIKRAAPEAEIIFCDGNSIQEAKKVAEEADSVIFVVGYNHDDEGEYITEDTENAYIEYQGGDRRYSLGLHEDEINLLRRVGPVNLCSVAVLIGGGMIMMEEWKDCVSAVLMAFYPGMEGGTALGEILFGDINPSGKLPYVTPFRESDLPQIEWDTRSQHYDYYHGYAKLEKEGIEPSVPYGFGMSYTTYEYSDAKFFTNKEQLVASCNVTNTGNREGAEVTELYVGFENSKTDRPVKLLRGFTRTSLQPGETKCVTITCPFSELEWYNPDTEQMELEHMEYRIAIGASAAEEDLLSGTIIL